MPDREKVIKGLECCADSCRNGCPYADIDDDCEGVLCADALSLLKEQKAGTVESIQIDRSDKWGADLTGYCPSCKRPLKSRFNKRFCGECGQAVKWK